MVLLDAGQIFGLPCLSLSQTIPDWSISVDKFSVAVDLGKSYLIRVKTVCDLAVDVRSSVSMTISQSHFVLLNDSLIKPY